MHSTRAAWNRISSVSATIPAARCSGQKEGLATAIFPQSMSSLCQGLRIQPLAESDLETQIAVIWKKGAENSLRFCRTLSMPAMESIL